MQRWLQDDNDTTTTTTTTERVVTIVSEILLFAMIFGLSASVETRQLKHQIRNYKSWIAGSVLQFLLMPLLGFISVKLFALPLSSGLALLIITSSPGGTLSNWWCATFNADLALSVTLTALSSVLAILFMPLNLLLYTNLAYNNDDAVESLEIGKLGISLAIIVGAIVSGTGAAFYWDNPRMRIGCYHVASGIGVILIFLAFWLNSQGTGENTKVWNQEPSTYVATALPCLIGMIAANWVAMFLKLAGPQRVTLSIEVGYQNTLVAISVLIRMFEDDELARAVAVPIFYGVTAAVITLMFVVTSWKLGHTKAPRNDPIWKVVTHMYEDHPSTAATDTQTSPKRSHVDDCENSPDETTIDDRQSEIIPQNNSDEAADGYKLDTRP